MICSAPKPGRNFPLPQDTTPAIIRFPFEGLASQYDNITLACINRGLHRETGDGTLLYPLTCGEITALSGERKTICAFSEILCAFCETLEA